MKYGYFSKDGYEFIITDPKTPRPWINYLTNKTYCSVISASGGGYSFYKDCRTERLLWFLGPNLYKDEPGRYIFIHDHDSKEAWSLTWMPLKVPYDKFESRVGLGYQIVKQISHGIESEITYFVPKDDPCELWRVKIKNLSSSSRRLSLFGYLEWWLGSREYINLYNIALLWNRVYFSPELEAVLAKKTAFYAEFNIQENPYLAFFSTSQKIDGWDCRKESFYPEGIYQGRCLNSECDGEEGVGVLQHQISLNPGEEKVIVFILGQTEGEQRAREVIKKYKDIKTVERELGEVKKFWREKIEQVKIETPDKEFDFMVNVWLKYQLWICNFWSRSPSFYHEGQGGRGYRDSCQDAEGILALDAEYARPKILKIASLTRRDGTVAPGWSDIYGPFPNRPFKDHPTWLTSTVSAYIKETGDINILNEKVPWLKDRWIKGGTQIGDWHQPAVSDGEGTLFEHLLAQLNFTFNDTSVHGLPRVGEADWNDALDMAGRRQIGESVWLGMALTRSLKLLAEMAELTQKKEIASDLHKKAEIMTERINKDGWDEMGWYIGGYNDDLVPFGSSKNKEGKIFLNSQAWAILSEVVSKERLPRILEATDRMLAGPHGYALLKPAYTKFDPGLGRIAMFSKGTKENAAVFCHAHTFMLAALCKLGMGTKAYQEMCKIMPSKQDIDLYKTEHYVYAEYLIGPEHPYLSGEGAYTWLTGTASWTFLLATEWLLGARRECAGLRIDPVIPSSWENCKITRPFRGSTYEISIENPERLEHGVKEVYVDGKKIEGNLIKPHKDGKVHLVRVVMGRR